VKSSHRITSDNNVLGQRLTFPLSPLPSDFRFAYSFSTNLPITLAWPSAYPHILKLLALIVYKYSPVAENPGPIDPNTRPNADFVSVIPGRLWMLRIRTWYCWWGRTRYRMTLVRSTHWTRTNRMLGVEIPLEFVLIGSKDEDCNLVINGSIGSCSWLWLKFWGMLSGTRSPLSTWGLRFKEYRVFALWNSDRSIIDTAWDSEVSPFDT